MISAERMMEIVNEQNKLGIDVEERMAARGIDYDELVKVAEACTKFGFPISVLFTAAFEVGYLVALEGVSDAEEAVERAVGDGGGNRGD